MAENKPIRSCNGCLYYYVTWDPKTPKGCRYFGFKSVQMPCIVVKKSTGQDCNMYTPKDGRQEGGNSNNNRSGGNIDRLI